MRDIIEAGTSKMEITPPLEVGLLTSSVREEYQPFKSVRTPLMGRVLSLKTKRECFVLVSLELLGLTENVVGGWDKFKKYISNGLKPENIIITCTHTHNAPESISLTNLYKKIPFKEWMLEVKDRLRNAIAESLSDMKEVELSLQNAELEGYSVQRRIHTSEGIVLSDRLQPLSKRFLNLGPIDNRIRLLKIKQKRGKTLATVIHAVCHPVHEMLIPVISSDYPGDLCRILEEKDENGMVLFLNGAAGNINPTTVSEGAKTSINHARAIVKSIEVATKPIFLRNEVVNRRKKINLKKREEIAFELYENVETNIRVVALGDLAIVFLSGEPFIETALNIEKKSPYTYTWIIGYSENYIGYIPTSKAIQEGGYETGPGKWSYLEKDADRIIEKETIAMLEEIRKIELKKVVL